ncbi:predicted protein [Arabidopsis lyrata subsp. lyrata]|uniref:Predicted protein n=1 Tax=Arabidopsis lyrata subsp. lyrata TaxID=81972 RepID=D7M3L1_ARALL|nr:predicted protein [Arabidopsis lyrata subsp. lyrata]
MTENGRSNPTNDQRLQRNETLTKSRIRSENPKKFSPRQQLPRSPQTKRTKLETKTKGKRIGGPTPALPKPPRAGHALEN